MIFLTTCNDAKSNYRIQPKTDSEEQKQYHYFGCQLHIETDDKTQQNINVVTSKQNVRIERTVRMFGIRDDQESYEKVQPQKKRRRMGENDQQEMNNRSFYRSFL